MTRKLLAHLRGQWIGALALLLVLTASGAWHLDVEDQGFAFVIP
jgi:hypothetical protein